jgi:hypothetical protein
MMLAMKTAKNNARRMRRTTVMVSATPIMGKL